MTDREPLLVRGCWCAAISHPTPAAGTARALRPPSIVATPPG